MPNFYKENDDIQFHFKHLDLDWVIQLKEEDFADKGVAISVPSLKVDEAFYELPEMLAAVRKTGLTFAPEAANDDLRGSLGKDVDMNVLCKSASIAYKHGWRRLKLYFMVGFPSQPEDEAESIIQCAVDNFGKIDILVNNAGILRVNDICEIVTEDWDLVLKTHVYGTLFCSRKACGYMRQQRYGRIINVSSHAGLGMKGQAPYSTAKEAITGFSRALARDVAEYGITCNVIRPLAAWRGIKKKVEAMEVLRPVDVAALVTYLVSESADHINGCIFEVWRSHVGIFVDPPPVSQVLWKHGDWTPEELQEAMPQTLTSGRSRENLPPTFPPFFRPPDEDELR